MPDQTFNIPENVREATGRAIARVLDPPVGDLDPSIPQRELETAADAAIQACLKEWGAREEFSGYETWRGGERKRVGDSRRLVFPWEPVEGDES